MLHHEESPEKRQYMATPISSGKSGIFPTPFLVARLGPKNVCLLRYEIC